MNYKKGSFITVPNKDQLRGRDSISQAVFLWLCSYADEEGVCFPSRAKLAKDCGITLRTVDRAVGSLTKWGMLTKVVRKDGIKNLTSLYQIQICEEGVVQPLHEGSANKDTRGSAGNDIVTKSIMNSIQLTSEVKPSQEIGIVIDAFKTINPAYKKWFGNKTQRASTERLVGEHGLEQILKVISILPITNKKRYMPTITTPLQLEDKWAQLRTNLERIKEEKKELQAQVAF